jgi:tetratricopeptide (TPR) repeat protein
MTPRLFITTFFVITFVSAFACLNENRVLLSGKTSVFDSESLVPYGHNYKDDIEYYEKELKELDSLWKTDKKIEDYSDYGVLLVYLGRYEEAKKVFIEIEKISPGLYATAANLGTTYELLGQNKLALEWIKKAVKIDPTSHDNSEWLHVKILEAKIQGDKFINSDFLISTNFGADTIPKTTKDSSSLIMLRDAIYYQLNERVSFIKPKEKIVALLLFELGNVCAITDDVTSALRIYDKAKEYGFESEVLNRRYDHFLKMQAGLDNEYSKNVPHPIKSNMPKSNYTLVTIIVVTLLLIAGVLFIRRQKNRS